jgi:hypothetical protein
MHCGLSQANFCQACIGYFFQFKKATFEGYVEHFLPAALSEAEGLRHWNDK